MAIEAGTVSVQEAENCSSPLLPTTIATTDAVELAVEAGKKALVHAGISAAAVGMILVAGMTESPSEWKRPARVARLLGADSSVVLGVRQMSNGGAMAVQLAIAQLRVDPALGTAMVITADALGADAPQRWQLGEIGVALGDSGTALILSSHGGPLRVLSAASRGYVGHEVGLPDGNPIGASPVRSPEAVAAGQAHLFQFRTCVSSAVRDAAQQAGISVDDPRIDLVVLPRVERRLAEVLMSGVRFRQDVQPRRVHLASEAGHLFSGDLLGNLEYLLREGTLSPGRIAMVLSVGSGFAVTCVMVERSAHSSL
ncbi:hypothetical protein [Jatrophihabitans sp. GAS493]|uniref:hypothetical protein n=1 Tax=Jatrophihabitans sp. GAS493 TaxID=1907575 RepID=UPI0012FD98C5|nr:hypothetical protein [Jatrophihabitans sp. GAS493]